jgi:hypothetical protein
VSHRQASQRNVIRSHGTAVRNQTRTWAKRIMHVSAMYMKINPVIWRHMLSARGRWHGKLRARGVT